MSIAASRKYCGAQASPATGSGVSDAQTVPYAARGLQNCQPGH
eukprot:CAMPEP_0179220952 /NCGR_PEP_ID=MMETSP0797-20121207/5916_1 /TAXON_ID=47934 /ORGANISM="Dinophysis acuminata, Strain DAEP01" /LENGTH=42 /DNA_ID= /DNA_START= /DNA_END= /DNA_ORIENTATION=